MISLLLAGLIVSQPEPKVTIVSPIVTTPKVLAELTKQTGIRHNASQQASGLYVYVNVKDLPAAKLRSHLAEVLHGKWRESEGQFFFTAPTEEERYRNLRFANFTERLKQHAPAPLSREAIIKAINDVEISRRRRSVDRNASIPPSMHLPRPESRFLWRCLGSIGAAQLAAIEPGEVRIYSSESLNSMVLPLSGGKDFLRLYNQERKFFTEVVSSIPNPSPNPDQVNNLYHPYLISKGVRNDAESFCVYVWLDEDSRTISIAGSMQDGDGLLLQGLSGFPFDQSPAEIREKRDLAFAEDAKVLAEEFLIKSKRDIDFLSAVSGPDPFDEDVVKPETLVAFRSTLRYETSQLLRTDWHSRWPTEFLSYFAEKTEKQIVASVNRSVPGVFFDMHLKDKVSSILWYAFGYNALDGGVARLDEGVYLLSPDEVPYGSYDFVRKAPILSKFYRLAASGAMGVAEYGQMALELQETTGSSLNLLTDMFEDPALNASEDFLPAMVFSLLSPDQARKAAASQVTLRLEALPPFLRGAVVYRLLEESYSYLKVLFGPSQGLDLSFSISNLDTWALINDDGYLNEADSSYLAYSIYFGMQKDPDYMKKARYFLASKAQLRLGLAAFSSSEKDIVGDYYFRKPGSSLVTFSQLPEQLRLETLEKLKEYDEMDDPSLLFQWR